MNSFICNIYCTNGYHLFWRPEFLHSKPYPLEEDYKRLSFSGSDISNPKFIVLELCSLNGKYFLDHINGNTSIDKNSITFDSKFRIFDSTGQYLKISKLKYTIEYSDVNNASIFHFYNDRIYYIKTIEEIKFHTIGYNEELNFFNYKSYNLSVIILASGESERFISSSKKQYFIYKDIPLFMYSINIFSKFTDDIILVTNDEDFARLYYSGKIVKGGKDRLSSIAIGLEHANDTGRLIIHDSARPFITTNMIENLLLQKGDYVQYYLPVVNGLALTRNKIESVNRNDYIELCTPFLTNAILYKFIFRTYIGKVSVEPFPILNILNIKYEMLQGSLATLRKVTYIEDLF